MGPTIFLHSDLNCFYAGVEMMGDLKMAQDKRETVVMPNFMYQ